MVRDEPLTEREIREALGLSHRARASPWPTRRSGGSSNGSRAAAGRRRGPAGTAFVAVGDHWQWFSSVIAERKIREGDPIVEVIGRTAGRPAASRADAPGRRRPVALRDWLATFNAFVRLFDRAVGLIPKLQPRELERGMRLLGEVQRRDGAPARPPARRAAGRRRPRS
jgi:hypothetical protein